MCITVVVRNPPTGDSADMARIVEQAAAADYDGMIVTIGDYDALRSAITGAVDTGMPVITVNSGTQEQSESMGALLHIGQPEFEAGRQAGVRASKDGIKDFVCFNHQMGNIPLTDRCAGYAAGLGVELGDRMVDIGGDPIEAKNRVFAYLKSHPDTPSILTLGPNGGNPTLQALEELGLAGEIYYGSFELSAEMIEGLKSGVLQWSIDQQQFFQGYLAANLLTNHLRYGVTVPHHINSGPGFTTKENIGLVENLAGTFR
jgi:simple sugar transport system substrate-binding protein